MSSRPKKEGRYEVPVILEDDSGREVDRGTISIPGKHVFNVKSPGRYKVYLLPKGQGKVEAKSKDGCDDLNGPGQIIVQADKEYLLSFNCGGSKPPSPPNPPDSSKKGTNSNNRRRNRPPHKAIIPSAIALTIMSNLGGATPFFEEISKQLINPSRSNFSTRNRPSETRQSSNQNGSSNRPQRRKYDNLSSEFELRIKNCIQSNLIRLLEIPTLSGYLELFSWQDEPDSDLERQLIFLYTNFNAIRDTIEECDPTLIQQISAAEERESTVMVIGNLVNIRDGSGPDASIISQVRHGTILAVDLETELSLSFLELLAIEQGNGWQPILLADGRRGYIYSLYIE